MNTLTRIPNWINGAHASPILSDWIEKINPHNGQIISLAADSCASDVELAVSVALRAFPSWAESPPVRRGQILSEIVVIMKRRADELAQCIAEETGKPPHDARAEVAGAILQGEFWAGEGMRLYGRSLTSGIPNKYSHTIRQPRGVAGLIVPANTPIANIAWKVFPALICGNTVVLKASEDSPRVANLFAIISKEAGTPDGVFNVIHGRGQNAGAALVENPGVSLISFTGSTEVGRWIAEVCGKRLARVSLELGGKNPIVICDDADLDHAVHWASLSGFSNAGQRCAAGSRVIVFQDIYDKFRNKLVEKANSLKLGVGEGCDLGPLINKKQHQRVLSAIHNAKSEGGEILCGGEIPDDHGLQNGFYVRPTIIDGLSRNADLARKEVFGPIISLHPAENMLDAVNLANSSDYGLTAAIHTRNIDRAVWFAHRVKAGVTNINFGTFGSEPHMPFGGFAASGNGTREPGVEALDVYSETKNISFLVRLNLV
jgi:acyl-CoA reductase-like NAD-dependent aldehyde dehydrogenase